MRSKPSKIQLPWSPCCCTGHRDEPMTRPLSERWTPMHDAMVCTIGHSNRAIEEFMSLLMANNITQVIDVRTIPRSRHNPQFNLDSLPASLAAAGIDYVHMPSLGGLRHAHPDSPNTGWHNASFRGYADHMQTAEFVEGIDQVMALTGSQRCALMCAEAVPWRCHRSLIADALLVRGINVEDIIGPLGRKPHKLTPFAKVEGLQLTYPPPETGDDDSIATPVTV